MAMVWIRVLPQAQGRDIQLTADVVHRSVEGDTIKLTPGHSREVTEDEWDFIQRTAADLLPGIQLLGDVNLASSGEVTDQPQ